MIELTFQLFKKLHFKVTDPIGLIEAFCFQSHFYINYDAVPVKERKIQHVNEIGARINKTLLPHVEQTLNDVKKLRIFNYDDDLGRLLGPDSGRMDEIVREFNEEAVNRLRIKGIGLSKATKALHTFHPETVPILDNPLQKLYKKEINPKWKAGNPQIFIDYYQNFQEGNSWEYLKTISKKLQQNNLALTKVRVFDILWWSYLKSKNLNKRLKKKQRTTINWLTLQMKDLK